MGIGKPLSMDQERVSFNLARIKKGGKVFEIVIDPDKAIEYKNSKKSDKKTDMDIKDVLRGEKIFFDAKKGIFAAESDLRSLFGSTDPLSVAEKILEDGELQLTKEHRDALRETKRKRILALIHRNAVDPKTRLPHPLTRLENAFEQAKCKINEFKSAEEQVDDIVKALRVILPIRIEQILLQIEIPPQFSHQTYGVLKNFGTISKDVWGSDGSLVVNMEIPAGLSEEITNKLNNMTHGGANIRILDDTRKLSR